jgi:DNA-binding transcriptional ArsR family regulator
MRRGVINGKQHDYCRSVQLPKPYAALFVFTVTLIAMVPVAATSHSGSSGSPAVTPNDLQTKVYQDADGNVHVLWLVPGTNNSLTGSGIWYSKYSPNGTDAIPPTRISNSTSIQAADFAVDNHDNAIIVWSDEITPAPTASSALYLLHFNSTSPQTKQILVTHGSLILWPSLAPADNGTIYMTWTEYNPSTAHALVEYGWIVSSTFAELKPIASYSQVNAFPPKARVVFDNSSRHLQVAWGESQADGQLGSTVNYAKFGLNGTLLTKLQVARFEETLRDVSITPLLGQDGAFVIWRTQTSNDSVYVSQISAGGELVYLKQLNYTTGQSRYLAVSTDLQDNLYVVWYEPSFPSQSTQTTIPSATNVTYLQMNFDGVILQTVNGVVSSPIIAVTVLNDGSLYGVSPDGLVRVVTPSHQNNPFVWVAAVALASCMGVAGSMWIEEGRYEWLSLCSAVTTHVNRKRRTTHEEVLRLLARKPGLNARDINRFGDKDKVGMRSLVELEKIGSISSFRDGLSRRFYLKPTEGSSIDTLRTRIMLWVLDHPGIWEAQLAKDLSLSQQIVHYHLKKLRDSKLITTAEDSNGSRKLYRFAKSAKDKRNSSDP